MLLEAAYSYSALCSYRIYYGLGKNGKFRSLEISFPDDAFYHLAGFQYITRNPIFVSKRQALYNVKSRKISEDDFINSEIRQMIENRWSTIVQIENAMKDTRFIMEYINTRGPIGSNIKARFVILNNVHGDKHYYFFDGKGDDKLVPVSCVIENERQYESGCAKWTVLRIEKKSQDGLYGEVIYCRDKSTPSADV